MEGYVLRIMVPLILNRYPYLWHIHRHCAISLPCGSSKLPPRHPQVRKGVKKQVWGTDLYLKLKLRIFYSLIGEPIFIEGRGHWFRNNIAHILSLHKSILTFLTVAGNISPETFMVKTFAGVLTCSHMRGSIADLHIPIWLVRSL